MQPRSEAEQVGLGGGAGAVAVGVPELPSWTMTRYVITITACALAGTHTYAWRTDMRSFECARLGMGFFSDAYIGHCTIVIKVLARLLLNCGIQSSGRIAVVWCE